MICLCSCGNNAKNELATTLSTENNGVQQSIVSDKTQSTKEYVTVEIKTDPDDPYSYTIKEKYDYVINKLSDPNYYHYAFYDVDGNGIEELLIGEPYVVGGIDNVEPPYEFTIMINELYTIENEEVVKKDIMPWWMNLSIFERTVLDNGLIRYVAGTAEKLNYLYLSFDDSEFVFQELGYYDEDLMYRFITPEMIAKINTDKTGFDREYELFLKAEEKEITAEEFERMRAEIEGDAKPVELKWKNIDEYGR